MACFKPSWSGVALIIITLFSQLPVDAQSHQFSVSGGGILNINDFNWSIAGNSQGQSPSVLSELHFNNITSAGFYLNGTYAPVKYLRFDAYYQRNGVVSGSGMDTDYKGDNRTDPVFQQPFSSDRGYLEVFRIGAAAIFLQRAKFSLGAGISYKDTRQNFVILSPELTDLQSTYTARWRGPAFSLEGNYLINRSLSVGANIAYTSISYRGEADWNLIDIFMHPLSFAQTAKGHGMDYGLSFRYAANGFLSFSLDGMLGNARISRGTDVSYLANGTQIPTQFNGSGNYFYGARLGAMVEF
jgi:Protochlamydia outer membrane protein